MPPIDLRRSIKVFIGYAHADKKSAPKIGRASEFSQNSGKITTWQDQEIPAGANWEDQINTHLNEADVILLLVSRSIYRLKLLLE